MSQIVHSGDDTRKKKSRERKEKRLVKDEDSFSIEFVTLADK